MSISSLNNPLSDAKTDISNNYVSKVHSTKYNFVVKHNLCSNCLLIGHKSKDCGKNKGLKCKGDTNILLHSL